LADPISDEVEYTAGALSPRPSSHTPAKVSSSHVERESPTWSATSQQTNEFSDHRVHTGDRERMLERYAAAITLLNNALKLGRASWESFEFPELDNTPESDDMSNLQDEIEKKLDSRKSSIENPNAWTKGKNLTSRISFVTSPFTKNFLLIAKEVQSVRPVVPICY
jgi:hypothetical protein